MIAVVVTAAVLTKPQYQALIDRANARVTKAENATRRGITPTASPARIAQLLDGQAAAESANARMFAAAEPPARVRKVNAELVRAERLFAAELRTMAHEIRTSKHPRATVSAMLHGPGPHPGPQLLDRAIARLHKLGYR